MDEIFFIFEIVKEFLQKTIMKSIDEIRILTESFIDKISCNEVASNEFIERVSKNFKDVLLS